MSQNINDLTLIFDKIDHIEKLIAKMNMSTENLNGTKSKTYKYVNSLTMQEIHEFLNELYDSSYANNCNFVPKKEKNMLTIDDIEELLGKYFIPPIKYYKPNYSILCATEPDKTPFDSKNFIDWFVKSNKSKTHLPSYSTSNVTQAPTVRSVFSDFDNFWNLSHCDSEIDVDECIQNKPSIDTFSNYTIPTNILNKETKKQQYNSYKEILDSKSGIPFEKILIAKSKNDLDSTLYEWSRSNEIVDANILDMFLEKGANLHKMYYENADNKGIGTNALYWLLYHKNANILNYLKTKGIINK